MSGGSQHVLKRQEKFAAYFGQNRDYLFYVGSYRNGLSGWTQVYQLDGMDLIGLDFQRVPLNAISSWLVAYPRTGEIVDGEQIFDPLPNGVVGDLQRALIDIPAFSKMDLDRGRKLVEVEISMSPTHPENPRYYSTRLVNRSGQKVRCLLFAGYGFSNGRSCLNTVTGRPYTSTQFNEWYEIDSTGWLAPNGVACDPSNYGSRCVWVYYFESESGDCFHTGVEVRRKEGVILRLLRFLNPWNRG